ncbi:MAG: hypothetical protein U0736_23465 [Gemmataceae bacterium]
MSKHLEPEEFVNMKSRVSWGAVLGGSVIALTVYFVLTLLFAGVNLSLPEAGVRAGTVSTVAVITGVLSMLIALFVGGWVTSCLTVGENRQEAVIHGVLTWAVITASMVMLVGAGFRTGYNALLTTSLAAHHANPNASWEDAARAAGVSEERITQLRRDLNPENIRAAASDPENQQEARRGVMTAVWSILIGTVLGLAAAAGGALAGAGPYFHRFFPHMVYHTTGEALVRSKV